MSGTVNLEAHFGLPADHSVPRVLGNSVMPEMAQHVGEGMLAA